MIDEVLASGDTVPVESRPLIVFDGFCSICSASAQFVLRHDRRQSFLLTMAQSPAGRNSYLGAGLDPDAMTTMIVIADGATYLGSDAVLRVLAEMGWPWRAAAILRIVPRRIRDRAYHLVARNRYRLIRRRESCWLPSDAMRNRFI